jgi:hypothetical protein
MGGLGFDAARIMAAIEHPDRPVDRFAWGNWIIKICTHPAGNKSTGEWTDVVGIGLNGEIRTILFAFQVFPDLCETPIKDLSPLQMVGALAERFGHVLTIGKKSGKLVVQEDFPRPPRGRRGQPFQDWLHVDHPKDETPFEVRADDADHRLVRVALAFSICHREYGRWVMNR